MLSPRGACVPRLGSRGLAPGGRRPLAPCTRHYRPQSVRAALTPSLSEGHTHTQTDSAQRAQESREKEKHVQTTTTNCLTCQWHDHETRESAESPLYTTRYSGQPCGSRQLSLIYATGALSGKSGLPVSDSWMTMPTMPIMAARPLLRSAFSLNSLTLGSE